MAEPAKKFLIVKLSSLGDVVHGLPFLRTLRVNFPAAHIAWAVEEKCKDVLYQNPDLDELIVVRSKKWRKDLGRQSLGELLDFVRLLRQRRFDAVFDLQGLIKSGLIAFLSRAPLRVGFHPRDCRERLNAWFTNRKGAFAGKGRHVVDKNLSLLNAVGARSFVKEFPLAVPAEAEAYIADYFKNNPDLAAGPLAAVNPGAGFQTKRWDLKRFAQLADRIAGELGCNVLLTWGPGEEDLVKAISANMRQNHRIAPPTGIHQSIALLRRMHLFVSCDTGPLHLCAALNVPTVSIFGPTDPARNGPYGNNHETVYKSLPCSFRYKRKCPTHNECMDQVTVDQAFAAVRKSFSIHVKVLAI
ncbi:MAG: lipopolysaccharide heptosyltransferase I [Nitrospinae bacterium]|nr:lipopolysaccharide heptosyltransferase I [Nitrospinota bacterium]